MATGAAEEAEADVGWDATEIVRRAIGKAVFEVVVVSKNAIVGSTTDAANNNSNNSKASAPAVKASGSSTHQSGGGGGGGGSGKQVKGAGGRRRAAPVTTTSLARADAAPPGPAPAPLGGGKNRESNVRWERAKKRREEQEQLQQQNAKRAPRKQFVPPQPRPRPPSDDRNNKNKAKRQPVQHNSHKSTTRTNSASGDNSNYDGDNNDSNNSNSNSDNSENTSASQTRITEDSASMLIGAAPPRPPVALPLVGDWWKNWEEFTESSEAVDVIHSPTLDRTSLLEFPTQPPKYIPPKRSKRSFERELQQTQRSLTQVRAAMSSLQQASLLPSQLEMVQTIQQQQAARQQQLAQRQQQANAFFDGTVLYYQPATLSPYKHHDHDNSSDHPLHHLFPSTSVTVHLPRPPNVPQLTLPQLRASQTNRRGLKSLSARADHVAIPQSSIQQALSSARNHRDAQNAGPIAPLPLPPHYGPFAPTNQSPRARHHVHHTLTLTSGGGGGGATGTSPPSLYQQGGDPVALTSPLRQQLPRMQLRTDVLVSVSVSVCVCVRIYHTRTTHAHAHSRHFQKQNMIEGLQHKQRAMRNGAQQPVVVVEHPTAAEEPEDWWDPSESNVAAELPELDS